MQQAARADSRFSENIKLGGVVGKPVAGHAQVYKGVNGDGEQCEISDPGDFWPCLAVKHSKHKRKQPENASLESRLGWRQRGLA